MERNLEVNTSETEDLPSQLPKIEQNQLPADCGHPLKPPGIPAVNKSVTRNIESAVGEIEGILMAHNRCLLLGQLRCY